LCKLLGEAGYFRKGKTPYKRPVSEANATIKQHSRSAQDSAPTFGFKTYIY